MKNKDRASVGETASLAEAASDGAPTWSLWADLEIEGALSAEERSLFEARLGAEPALAAEHRQLGRLHELLAAEKVEVKEGFSARVMENLPAAGWERSPARAWVLPLAAMLVFGVAASLLLDGGLREGPFFGTGFALFDFLQTTALAGAGLLSATWRAAGLGLDHLFEQSGVNLAVLAAGVVMLNLLFFRMLRRGHRKVTARAEPGPDSKR